MKSELVMNKLVARTIIALALPFAVTFPAMAQQGGTPPAQTQPSAKQSAGAVKLDADQIRQLQQSLNEHGFNAGEVDGVFGARTREALKKFQSQAGLPATGELDAQTLTAVGHGDKIGAGEPSSAGQGSTQGRPAAQDPTTGKGETSDQPGRASPDKQ
jgi:peptidoglycan hydrolase-like protein with peptidoglycan-binding domain